MPRRRGPFGLAVLIATLLYAVGLASGVCADADDLTGQYFNELRRRRLFNLIEGECLRRLGEEQRPLAERTALTIELSRTFAMHARYVPEDQQQDLWDRAEETLAELIKAHPGSPRRILLEAQRRVLPGERGEDLRRKSELYPFDEQRRQEAIRVLREALGPLQDIERRLEQQLKDAGTRPSPGEVTPRELRHALRNVRLVLGKSYLDLATLLDEDDPQREKLIEAAVADPPVGKPGPLTLLANGPREGAETWSARVLIAVAARLRGHHARAAELLDQIEKESPGLGVMNRVVAESVRLLLESEQRENYVEASQLLLDYRKQQPHQTGELQYLNVAALLRLWNVAVANEDKPVASKLMQRIEADVARAEREVGGYWLARCREVLALARASSKYGRDIAVMMQRARGLFAGGRTDEAVAAYGEATTAAHRAGFRDLAFDLGFTRGSILFHAGRYDAAATAFGELVEHYGSNKRAAAAHLLKVYSLSKSYAQQRTKSRRETYASALAEHREMFRDDPSYWEATWLTAQFQESRRQAGKALRLYAEIPKDTPHGAEASVGVARCYEQVLYHLRHEAETPDPATIRHWEEEALRVLKQMTGAAGKPVSSLKGEVLVRTARIMLGAEKADYDGAEELLARVLASYESVADDLPGMAQTAQTRWQWLFQTATQLRVISLAGQHRIGEAHILIGELARREPAELLTVLDGLTSLAERVGSEQKEELGLLQLKAAESLRRRRDQLDDVNRDRLDECLGQAYAATGQVMKAIPFYENLLSRDPKNRTLLRTIAELELECGTSECLRRALKHWKRLERFERKGSVGWLDVRYRVAMCHYRRDEHEQALKVLGLGRLLYLDRASAAFRKKWHALEAEIKKAAEP